MSAKFLARADLTAWLEELSALFRVHAPQRNGAAVLYRPWTPEKGVPELGQRPTESAKHVLFPRSERLFSFSKTPDGVTLREADPLECTGGPALIFGLLPCDARGFTLFDPVYGSRKSGSGEESKGGGNGGNAKDRAPDPYYLKRREKAVLIARACRAPLSTCFCTWMNGDPAGAEGADVLVTDLPGQGGQIRQSGQAGAGGESGQNDPASQIRQASRAGQGGFLLVPVTDKGRAVLGSALLREAGEEETAQALAAQKSCRDKLPPVPDLSGAPEAMLGIFENADFWQDRSAGCLSCGACTFLCPTCYCFNITDQATGKAGLRLRSWDTCMAFGYTLETSGHNPRPDKAARLRNRVGHKFAYYPQREGGRMLCTGCGRCVRSCPSSVDIRGIVLDALKEAGDAQG